jgi:hypothetical protein
MKLNKCFGTLLFAGAILVGCSKATDSLKPQTAQKQETEKATEESQVTETPQGPNAFILKIEAENAATKALTDLGQTLGSEWKQGDSISVYNVTTGEAIEGWLYAEADGTSTTFSGTVAGNFNQGDILLLQFLAPDYMQQDGTLEGLAAQCDYATSQVEVTAIDPEAKTISTEQANFEKMQAVVKFNITNRKNPVEPVKVTSFMGYGKLPGQEIPFGIYVKPAVATDELYVGIPYIENLKITFEAEGEDGFDYRLIVPEVSFEDGLYYRRQLNMKRKANVKAPVAIDTLVYNSVPQKLVEPAHVYWMVNGQEIILDHDKDYQQDSCVISYFVKKEVTAGTVPTAPTAAENGWLNEIPTQTHAGTYYVWTKMTGNYDYEDADVSDNPVKVVIAKATPTINATAVSTDMTYNAQSQNLLSGAAALKIGDTVVTTEKDAAATACTIKYYVTTENLSQAPAANASGWGTSYAAVHAGTYYIWIMTEGNGDMNAATAKVTKSVAKATVSVDVSAVSGDLVFNTQQQNLLSAAAKIKLGTKDVTTATDDQSKACVISYYVSSSNSTATGGSWGTSYSAKNPGTWYVWVKVTGNGDINDVAAASKVSKYIDKATPTVTTTPTAKTGLVYNGAAQNLANAGSTNGGTLKYSTDNVNWSNNVPTGTNAGSYTVYWKVVGNDYYYDKSGGNFTVTIAKANGWVTLSSYSHTFNKTGLVQFCSFTVNSTSGGSFSLSGNPSGFIAQTDGNTVTIVRTGSNVTVTYTVSTPETANYKAATATFTCYKGN